MAKHMTTARVITLEKPTTKGSDKFRIVFVDGEPWGYFDTEHRGMHGAAYLLVDSHNNYVFDPGAYRSLAERRNALRVKSDKGFLRDLGFYGRSDGYALREAKAAGRYIPLKDRLVALVESAIKAGWLKSPATLAREVEELKVALDEQEQARAKKMADAFDARAAKAVEGLPEKYRAKMIQPILDAMKWARAR